MQDLPGSLHSPYIILQTFYFVSCKMRSYVEQVSATNLLRVMSHFLAPFINVSPTCILKKMVVPTKRTPMLRPLLFISLEEEYKAYFSKLFLQLGQ